MGLSCPPTPGERVGRAHDSKKPSLRLLCDSPGLDFRLAFSNLSRQPGLVFESTLGKLGVHPPGACSAGSHLSLLTPSPFVPYSGCHRRLLPFLYSLLCFHTLYCPLPDWSQLPVSVLLQRAKSAASPLLCQVHILAQPVVAVVLFSSYCY